jgi:NADH:ubiquinone oxidoreductase subunit 4 (subunit M)
VYLLRVLRELWHGPARRASADADVPASTIGPFMGDATTHEIAVAAPLVVATLALGLLPWLLLDVTAPVVRQLLIGGLP